VIPVDTTACTLLSRGVLEYYLPHALYPTKGNLILNQTDRKSQPTMDRLQLQHNQHKTKQGTDRLLPWIT
jgi:hypothetical protein